MGSVADAELPLDDPLLLSLLIAEAEQVSADPSTNIARRADCTTKSRCRYGTVQATTATARSFFPPLRFGDQGQGLAPKATYTHTRNFTFSRTGLARGAACSNGIGSQRRRLLSPSYAGNRASTAS
ncbi:hypothetical protein ISCGN_002609 [Ixodes scapularis]